ncbi:uncharacterized protein LOC114298506 [Camellia sinensis]|uniref:uncharacterized protein LOC114298506 n=1 Tax=Camellia sinensis TaxID=4442 RepID=UPI00103660AC|nr:uncharacterized protein LOC114298506 [Camellia sinensis]
MAVWLAAKSGQSFVSTLYQYTDLQHGEVMSSCRLVWVKYLPPKVQFFGWLAWKHKVKTSVFLNRIGVLNASAGTTCLFCKQSQETVEHLLILCPKVWRVWAGLLQWWGAQWVTPRSVAELLQWWAGNKCTKAERRIWDAIPLVALWSIWKHRNECLFQDVQPNLEEMHETIVVRTTIWLKSDSRDLHYPITDYVYNLVQIRRCLGGRM